MKKQKLAIFDVDGTIFRSSLLLELMETLVQKGFFPKSSTADYSQAREKWEQRKGDYGEYIIKVVQSFRKHLKGIKTSDFEKICGQVADFHADRNYRYTLKLTKNLKKKGYFLLAISHSPKTIVQRFCSKLGFDKVYGLMYETDAKQKFTGKVIGEDIIKNKINILSRVIEKEGLFLKNSYGVGDTESDISFLEAVENPICFNPNKKLYDHACEKNWKIVVERKDVIYEISKETS